jgi:hypothetical protein
MRIRGLCILALPIAVAMAACTTPTDQDADEQDEGPVQSTYRVQGSDMGRSWQNIVVQRDGVGLAGAEVRVNGTLIPDWPDVAGEYYGSIPIVDSGPARARAGESDGRCRVRERNTRPGEVDEQCGSGAVPGLGQLVLRDRLRHGHDVRSGRRGPDVHDSGRGPAR